MATSQISSNFNIKIFLIPIYKFKYFKDVITTIYFEFTCPSIVELNKIFYCNITLNQYNSGNTITHIYIDFGDGSTNRTFDLNGYSKSIKYNTIKNWKYGYTYLIIQIIGVPQTIPDPDISTLLVNNKGIISFNNQPFTTTSISYIELYSNKEGLLQITVK